MSFIHKQMAAGRWQTLSFAAQLGNIGSEICRARMSAERGDEESRNRALGRALELVGLTLAGETSQARSRELAQLRQALFDVQNGDQAPSLAQLEQYCLPFAVLARGS